jgi:probable addiction module antidote protein
VSKPKIKTTRWDTASYLKSDRDIAYHLEAVFEDGDPELIAHALGDVARAKRMTKIAQAAGLSELSANGGQRLATVLKVLQALGLKLKVAA